MQLLGIFLNTLFKYSFLYWIPLKQWLKSLSISVTFFHSSSLSLVLLFPPKICHHVTLTSTCSLALFSSQNTSSPHSHFHLYPLKPVCLLLPLQEDFHYEFTECDATGGRWRVSVPTIDAMDTCEGGDPKPPRRTQGCSEWALIFTCLCLCWCCYVFPSNWLPLSSLFLLGFIPSLRNFCSSLLFVLFLIFSQIIFLLNVLFPCFFSFILVIFLHLSFVFLLILFFVLFLVLVCFFVLDVLFDLAFPLPCPPLSPPHPPPLSLQPLILYSFSFLSLFSFFALSSLI